MRGLFLDRHEGVDHQVASPCGWDEGLGLELGVLGMRTACPFALVETRGAAGGVVGGLLALFTG